MWPITYTGGIIALLLGEAGLAAPELYEGLGLLQHRGQDACGIVTCGPKGRFHQMKGNGMVRDVLDPSALSSLIGTMGIGHGRSSSVAATRDFPFFRLASYATRRKSMGGSTLYDSKEVTDLVSNCCSIARYPTAGSSQAAEAQPFYVNSPYGIVFGHVSRFKKVFGLSRSAHQAAFSAYKHLTS